MTKTGTALDPEKDFETPVRKQMTLIEGEGEAQTVVRDGFIAATFVKPHLARDKNDKAFISFELSLPLEDEHKKGKVVPKRLPEAWAAVEDHGFDEVSIPDVPAQTITMAVAPEAAKDKTALSIPFVEIEKAEISVVEEKGTGESRVVTRLRFRAKCELDNENWRFARVHFGHVVWIKLEKTQGSLLEE
jgi:hypothetical protein